MKDKYENGGGEMEGDRRWSLNARVSLTRHLALALSNLSMVIPMAKIIKDAISSNMPI